MNTSAPCSWCRGILSLPCSFQTFSTHLPFLAHNGKPVLRWLPMMRMAMRAWPVLFVVWCWAACGCPVTCPPPRSGHAPRCAPFCGSRGLNGRRQDTRWITSCPSARAERTGRKTCSCSPSGSTAKRHERICGCAGK